MDIPSSLLFWPIPARTFACLEFTFGVPYRIHDARIPIPERTFASALIGAKTHRQVTLELNGHVETFAILFQPTGLQQLFGVPASEIVDTHYDASGVIGAALSQLRTELGEATSFAGRVAVANDYLTRQAAQAEPPDVARFAAEAIISSLGCIRKRGWRTKPV